LSHYPARGHCSFKLLLEAEEKPKPKIGFMVKEGVKDYGRKRRG
jgi:hypothetical protein